MKKVFLSIMLLLIGLGTSVSAVSANEVPKEATAVIEERGGVLNISNADFWNFSFKNIDYQKYNVINFEWTYPFIPNSDVGMAEMQSFLYGMLPDVMAANGLNSTYNQNNTVVFNFNINYTLENGTLRKDTFFGQALKDALQKTSMASLVGTKILILS